MGGHQVPNVYKEELQSYRPGAAANADTLQWALEGAAKAMAAGAWQSTTATAFEHALTAHRRILRIAAGSVTQEFDTKIRSEPDLVDEHSWQAMFMRMKRLRV